jgi:hypothetical protein
MATFIWARGLAGAAAGAGLGWAIAGPIGGIVGFVGGAIAGWAQIAPPDQSDVGGPQRSVLDVPSAGEGNVICDLLGTSMIAGNVIFYADNRSVPITAEIPGASKTGERQTTGWTYFLAWALALCRGPVDKLWCVKVEDVYSWTACHTGGLSRPSNGYPSLLSISNRIFGGCNFYWGTKTQPWNPAFGNYLARQGIDPNLAPGYINLCYGFFDPCSLGTTNRVPAVKFVLTKRPAFNFNNKHEVGIYYYNPAHAIWYILTSLIGLSEDWLDGASFSAAADRLHTEGNGVSILFDKASSASSYLESILFHIDAGLRLTMDGTLALRLFRRDVDLEDIPVIVETDMAEEPEVERDDPSEAINVLQVKWTELHQALISPGNYQVLDFVDREMGAKDITMIRAAGRQIVKSINLAFYNDAGNVSRRLWRELRRQSCLNRINLTLSRKWAALEPGDLIAVNYPVYGLTGQVFRILERQEEELASEALRFSAIEDVDYLGEHVAFEPELGGLAMEEWSLDPFTNARVVEPPYLWRQYDNAVIALAGQEHEKQTGGRVYCAPPGEDFTPLAEIPLVVAGKLVKNYYGDGTALDDTVGIEVEIALGAESLFSRSRTDMIEGRNLAVVYHFSAQWGGWHWFSWRDIEALGDNQYKLSGINNWLPGSQLYEGLRPAGYKFAAAGDWVYFLNKIEQASLIADSRFKLEIETEFKIVPVAGIFTGALDETYPMAHRMALPSCCPLPPSGLRANGKLRWPTFLSTGSIALSWRTAVRGGGAGWGDAERVTDAAPAWEGLFTIAVSGQNDPYDPMGWTPIKNVVTDAPAWTYTNAAMIADGGVRDWYRFAVYADAGGKYGDDLIVTPGYRTYGPAIEVKKI